MYMAALSFKILFTSFEKPAKPTTVRLYYLFLLKIYRFCAKHED
jgi:hypothetical protein